MESHSGAEAVALAMLRRFDTIVLDLRMPDMDGLEVAAYVRSGGESQAARLILLSANALPEDEGHLRAPANQTPREIGPDETEPSGDQDTAARKVTTQGGFELGAGHGFGESATGRRGRDRSGR